MEFFQINYKISVTAENWKIIVYVNSVCEIYFLVEMGQIISRNTHTRVSIPLPMPMYLYYQR